MQTLYCYSFENFTEIFIFFTFQNFSNSKNNEIFTGTLTHGDYSEQQMLSQASPLNAPAASAPAGPPPTMFAPAAPPVVPSPEPSFEQMLSSATPLNAPAAANGGPPSGRNSAPDSRDSGATRGAGRPSRAEAGL